MNRVQGAHLTECGIPGIGPIPYGLHFCQFYRGRQDLIECLVPYFVAGLRANERCLWITAPPLPAAEAQWELSGRIPDAEALIDAGQLRIVDFRDWYLNTSGPRGGEVIELWLNEEKAALRDGYAGLRITGNTSFLGPDDWEAFMSYEEALSKAFLGRRIVALCSYTLHSFTGSQVMDVVRSHNCGLDCTAEGWQLIAPIAGRGMPTMDLARRNEKVRDEG